MSDLIMATKLYIPTPRPKAVLRPRLTERLSKGLYRKFSLISAPAGYGKTTLVCEWLADCDRPAAWLSLEEGDSELTRFLTCMISSLQTLEENIGEGVLAVLQTPQLPPIESILTALLNEIAAIPTPFILVLDDYHVVNSKSVDDAVFFLLDHLPAQMHLVMTTREGPSIPLARLRVRDQLTELRAADIRFTLSESEDFLNRIMGLNLSLDKVSSLESRTEGWVAGLHLAALSIQGDHDAERLIQTFAGSHHFVLDYLIEEVLQRLPEAVQTFLLRTSILDRMCGSLCDDVMLDPAVSGKKTLMDLERNNLFVVPLDNERHWYRYHHLFADLLRKRLQESLDGSNIAEFHKRASDWYENNGLEVEAFRHAVESHDIERSARLLEGKGMPLHLRGAAAISLNWLESLPAAELDARPALWVMYGSALLIAGKLTGIEHKLRVAELALADAEQDARVRDLIGLIAATRATLASLVLTGNSDGADRKLQVAEAAMKNTRTDDKTDDLVGLIAPTSDVWISGNQGIDNVIVQSRRALSYLRPDNIAIRTAAAWMLGVACQRCGDHSTAREAYNEVISNSLMMGHQLMAVMAMIGLGQIEEAENRASSALEYYQEALRLGGDLPLPALREAQSGLERVSKRGMKSNLIESLSQREVEVLELIAKGLSNREIGEKLFLALDTVKGHNRRIFEKLQVQRRTEAIARAGELNLFPNTRKPH
ncbi:MAG: LuxR C-terminal-related transcriptional regulator [Candidatus Cohnella colombiensis]|uniref:LuxR C-terminal-related transcriptional regulator n=1 Tax=Candidatus Cohnella colombiensis TaxID=3121368 RepID=A0AA95JCQ7_9BACL|nr:MAG: LuxR C-terminal-related transcriptional regulator [Cohnella sp.]